MAINAIREVAKIIYDARVYDATGDVNFDYVQRQNTSDEGWTLQTPGSLGSTVVTPGVHLGNAGLKQAWDLAEKWLLMGS